MKILNNKLFNWASVLAGMVAQIGVCKVNSTRGIKLIVGAVLTSSAFTNCRKKAFT